MKYMGNIQKDKEGGKMAEDLGKYISVLVSDDKMKADLFLSEVEDPTIYDVDSIIDYMKEREKIIMGVKPSIIMNMINERIYEKMVTVAFGCPTVEGENGHYDFKFNTTPSKKPKLLEDGSVDYYNLSLIETVGEGQLVAEYIPKTEGTNGWDIFGKTLLAAKTIEIAPLRGKGFKVSEDGKKYYALFNGKIELNMNIMNISPTYVIPGDVDLSTGNIDFRGDLEIMGSIKAGMIVKATGNITVNKLVEAAHVEAGKDVLVRGGILGGGKAVIQAGNNIYGLFIENATIKANNAIQADSIVNCDVTAYSDINILGRTSAIVGGHLRANRTIRTRKIGSEVGVTTEVVVGIEPEAKATYNKMMAELEEMQEELEKIEKTIELLAHKPDADENLRIQLVRTKIEHSAELSKKKELCTELKKRIEIGKYAEIVAEEVVYPGAVIKIDGIMTHVEDEYREIMFIRKCDKILTRKCRRDDE